MPIQTLIARRSHLSFMLLAGLASTGFAQDQATYEIEFVAEWSQATHPAAFPNNPHFSPLIGTTHNDLLSIWAPNGIATNGIEVMAESGGTSALQSEILSHIDSGTADQFIRFGGIPRSPGSVSGTVEVDSEFPLLSLFTMIAPSPDWFVGIHGLDLRQGGLWANEFVIDLEAYDSGTDAGFNYTSSNVNLAEHLPILNLSNQFPFSETPRIGTLRITRTSDAACSLADLAMPYNELDFFDVSAFLDAFGAQDPVADLNQDGENDFFDVSAYLDQFAAGCP